MGHSGRDVYVEMSLELTGDQVTATVRHPSVIILPLKTAIIITL